MTGNDIKALNEMYDTVTSTDCRSDEGITVGLIDGIIAMCRIIRKSKLGGEAISEAFKDLRADEDVNFVFSGASTENT